MNQILQELKVLLYSDGWPMATNPKLICDTTSEVMKTERAESIISFVIPSSLQGLKFLDFGCGEGHVVKQAMLSGAFVGVGYDIIQPDSPQFVWNDFSSGCLLTSNYNAVLEHAPYDFILLYDVLDHLTCDEDAVDVLSKIKSLLSEKGTAYISCHPWASRHGGHLYQTLNKAFAHLVFTKEELSGIAPTTKYESIQNVVRPTLTYRQWFAKVGLKVKEQICRRDEVEKFFFENELIRDRIYQNMNYDEKDFNRSFACWQMAHSFIDFVVSPSSEEIKVPDAYESVVVNHVVAGRDHYKHQLWSNGRIGGENSPSLWEVQSGNIIMRWPGRVHGGYYVDTCRMDSNGFHYDGKNQLGLQIVGYINWHAV